VSHALLFAGNEGSGNLALAIAFASYLLCPNKSKDERCGQCAQCKQLDQLAHPDLHFSFPFIKKGDQIKTTDTFQRAFKESVRNNPYLSLKEWEIQVAGDNKQSIITVDESTEIIKKLSLKSFAGGYKVMIIWMPEKLNTQAQNRLLKTLEEPSARTVVILVSSKVDELLPTIVSRTQTVKCRPLRASEIAEGLRSLESADAATARDISIRAAGNYNVALKILQNPEGESAYFELFRDWMRTCVSPKNHDLIEITEKISALGRDEQVYFLEYCLQFLQEAISFSYLGENKASYTGAAAAFAKKFAPYIVGKDLGAFHDVLSRGQMLVERNAYSKLLYMKLSAEMIRIFKNQQPEVIS